MVKGLLMEIESGSHWSWIDVEVVEDLDDLELDEKYCFEIGWSKAGETIHIIWRYESEMGTRVHFADNHKEASEIFRSLVSEKLEEVNEEDRREMIKILGKYGGPSETWTNR